MAVRLRYLAHDLEVPAGQFVIGRTPDCQLSLDDPLVSRRHALLVVKHDGVFVEDLGSRNGVFVNGNKIEGQVKLRDDDAIKIGGQEMTVHGVGDHPHSSSPANRTRTVQDMPAYVDPPTTSEFLEENTTVIASRPLFTPRPDRRVSALNLIGGVADKAFAMGRADEAERILQRPLTDVLGKVESGEPLQGEFAERAVSYALRLAGATGKGVWIDYVFRLYTALAILPPAKLVDEIYAVVRKVKQTDRALLRAYTARLRQVDGSFGPADRFVQQRLEGLERWIP
jgi:hypothetical protein